MKDLKENMEMITDEELLRLAVEMEDEEDFDLAEYEHSASLLEMEPDQEMLEIARRYDARQKTLKKKKLMKGITRAAAVFAVCLGLTTAVASAFHVNVFKLIFNPDSGSVTLLSETEQEMIGDWEGYWYPEYLPEGFYLAEAEETKFSKAMLFVSNDSDATIVITNDKSGTQYSFDMDTTEMEPLEVESYEGYYFCDEQNNHSYAIWQTEDIIVRITFENMIDKELCVRIAEGMRYVG